MGESQGSTGEGVVLEHLHARMGLGIISEGLLRGSTRDLQLETSTSFRERPELAATWVQPLGTVARAVVAGRLEWAGLTAAASFARPDGEARPLPPQEQPSTGVAPRAPPSAIPRRKKKAFFLMNEPLYQGGIAAQDAAHRAGLRIHEDDLRSVPGFLSIPPDYVEQPPEPGHGYCTAIMMGEVVELATSGTVIPSTCRQVTPLPPFPPLPTHPTPPTLPSSHTTHPLIPLSPHPLHPATPLLSGRRVGLRVGAQ